MVWNRTVVPPKLDVEWNMNIERWRSSVSNLKLNSFRSDQGLHSYIFRCPYCFQRAKPLVYNI